MPARDDLAAMTVRIRPDLYKVWMDRTGAIGISGGAAARLVLEAFSERLRVNGGDMLGALCEFRSIVKPTAAASGRREAKEANDA